MQTEKITIHTTTLANGVHVQYARILRKQGRTTIGQSISLRYLCPEQRRRARERKIDKKLYSSLK